MTEQALVSIRDPHLDPFAGLDWRERLARLRQRIAALGRVVVAYSGGVDSSVVLRVAHEQLGAGALAVIGRSDSYALRELDLALAQAADIGATVEVVRTGELANPDFASNPADRCYHCKSELYRQLTAVAARFGATTILDGTIADDVHDHRPGRRAAAESRVLSPLAELGFCKADVRAVAAHLGLASSAKPASPCLASRIPYGTTITPGILSQVERAEQALRDLGFDDLRVRHHGDVARVEVPVDDLPRLLEPALRQAAVDALRTAGYRFVSVDLEGLRSGSLNRVLDSSQESSPRQN